MSDFFDQWEQWLRALDDGRAATRLPEAQDEEHEPDALDPVRGRPSALEEPSGG